MVSLDALAGGARPRLEMAGFAPRSPAPALVRTADVRVAAQLGRPPARPGWLAQLVDLGMPFGYGEQAPFLGREISAIRLTTAADDGAGATTDTTASLDQDQFVRLGRAAESILASLDGGIELAGGTAGYVYLGSRVVRGWALELVFLVALVPFLVGAIDLFARTRRRRLPLPGAWRALRTRLGVWLWVGLAVGLGALAGVFPRGSAIPPPPDSPAVTDWPVVGLIALGALAALGWLRARRVLVPVRPAQPDEVLAGLCRRARRARRSSPSRRRSSARTASSSSCRRSTRGSGCRRLEHRSDWVRDVALRGRPRGPGARRSSRSAPSSGSDSTRRSTCSR